MDQYKQLKESLNRVPNLIQPEQNHVPHQPQIATVAAESHVHEAQHAHQPSSTILPHKEEPAYDGHRDTNFKVTKVFLFFPFDIYQLLCFPLDETAASFQVNPQVEEVHPTVSHNTLLEKEEDQEGEAERRRELAEEEMAQAGQPQKLEEDPDQPQDEQQEEGEEEGPEQERPDVNALDRQRRHPQVVRTVSM